MLWKTFFALNGSTLQVKITILYRNEDDHKKEDGTKTEDDSKIKNGNQNEKDTPNERICPLEIASLSNVLANKFCCTFSFPFYQRCNDSNFCFVFITGGWESIMFYFWKMPVDG